VARRTAAATKDTATTGPEVETRGLLLQAAERSLCAHGYSGFSTRAVAEAAAMPLSQIHYYFGSKDALLLAVLRHQNNRLLERQRAMFAVDLPLWKRWQKACDYLDEDLASGYVRVLQEMMAAGWSKPEVATAVREFLSGWYELLGDVGKEVVARAGPVGPLKPDDIATLVGNAFLGCEAMLLLGFEEAGMPIRRALRRFGALIRELEEAEPRRN
jgi:AcrR family transcriptional regulator